MLPQQKEALFALLATFLASLLFFIIPPIPNEDLLVKVLVLMLVHIVSIWILRQRFGVRRQTLDERDIKFRYQSGIIGLSIFSGNVVLGCLVLVYIFQRQQAIPSSILLTVLFFCWMSLYLSWAITTLIQYHREG